MNEHESTRESDEAKVDSSVSTADPSAQRGRSEAGTERPASGAQPDAAGVDPEEAPDGELAARDRQIETLLARLAEREEALLRAKAEMDNARKRAERDVENAHRFGVERLVGELLPIKDSMELGVAACGNEGANLDSVREGVELTLRMLHSALEKFGVTEIEPTGEAFNPEFHQAMSMQEVEGVAAGRVVAVVQRGYLLNDRLVRPAMVIVSR